MSEKNEEIVNVNAQPELNNEIVYPELTWKQKFRSIIWDSLDKSPEEKRLLLKIDFCILVYSSYGYFIRTLDQTNVSNAYVSGMKEDLKMSGNQYNFLTTWFFIGYCIGQIPSQFMITRIKPSIWLPTCELFWSAFVMAIAGAKNVKTIYVLRFFIGFFEASSYIGIITILSSWYKKDELGKRTCLFQSSISIANMFSGYLQDGLHSGMDGRLGLHSWQWLFIFDGIIAFPVIIFGYFAIPDSPYDSKAFWLSPDEKNLAISRMVKIGRVPLKKKFSMKDFAQIWKTWYLYFFTVILSCHTLTNRLGGYLNLYLKSTGKFSVSQINVIPTGGYAFQFVACLIYAWVSDGIQKRWPVLIVSCLIALVGDIILCCWPAYNSTLIIFAWYLILMLSPGSALIVVWLNELMTFSAEQRYMVLGIIEALTFQFNAWVPLYIFDSGEAPRYRYGYYIVILFMGLEIVSVCVMAFLAHRDEANGSHERKIKESLLEYEDLKVFNANV